MRSFLVALAFLTILPIRFISIPSEPVLARSRFWFPVVGLMFGFGLGGAAHLWLWTGRPPRLGAVLLLTLWVALTGALHIDGFCDLCDALFVGPDADRRLHILKDPHLGTFGLVGGVLLLLGKYVALTQILTNRAEQGPWLIGLILAMARCLVLVMAAGAKYPREQGTGKILIEATRTGEAFLFGGLGLMLAGLSTWLLSSGTPLVLIASGLSATLLLRWLCVRRLGGITGDCLGANIELNELVWLLGVALMD